VEARKVGGGQEPILKPHYKRLEALLEEQPDLTLKEIRSLLGVNVSLTTVGEAIRTLGYTFKKILRASEQERPDVAEKRKQWKQRQPSLDAKRLVFIDKTSASTNMARQYGRSLKGRHLVSPDLNPIEPLFAKLKSLLRSATKRSVDALWDCISELLNSFSAQECARYFANSWYLVTTSIPKRL